MRHGQLGGVEHEVVVEQEVEVHRAGAPALVALAVERVLHRGQHAHHIVRAEIGLEEAGPVEKRRLPNGTADGPGVAKPTHPHQPDPGHEPQQFQGAIQEIPALADIRATSDKASCHGVSHQEEDRPNFSSQHLAWSNTRPKKTR